MARYRKLLLVSPIGLVAMVMALYSPQLLEWNPKHSKQDNPIYAESGSEGVEESRASVQIIPFGNGNRVREVQPTIEDDSITEDSQDITTASESITVSGWVGTEFGEIRAFEKVVLYSPSLRANYSMVTNDYGEFVFTDLKPAWDYVLKVSPQGLFNRYIKSPIALKADQEIHNIVLEAIPLGVLTGRIVDSYEQPVAGIELLMQTVETDFWSAKTITDANGAFSVAEFPKGKYQLMSQGQQTLRVIGLKFDPDVDEPVNLTIDLGPYDLTGRIYDESGQIFDSARVMLIWASQKNGVRIRSIRQVSADASGQFQFIGLGPGDHELVVSAWRVDASGETIKQTLRQRVNMGVESGELTVIF